MGCKFSKKNMGCQFSKKIWVANFQKKYVLPIFKKDMGCQFSKKNMNWECCHCHSLFKGHKAIVDNVVLNWQQCNQCLKCQVVDENFYLQIVWVANF